MKKWTKPLAILSVLVLPILLWVGVARAQSFRTGHSSIVAPSEVVNSSLYAAGRTVDIAGQVNGDVICAGQNVTISGKVNGDVICAGQTVHVSGIVTGDVRVAGQTVTVNANVTGNLTAAAQSFSLAGESKIGRDVGVAGSDVTLDGDIGRDLAIGGSNINIANIIGRSVTAGVQNLTIRDQAHVGGDLTYTSTDQASIASRAHIAGRTTWHKAKGQSHGNRYGRMFAVSLGVGAVVVVSLLLSTFVLVLLFPATFQQATKRALGDPLKTFLTGLLASFAVPVLIVALMMTVIGLPLGLLLLFSWLLVLFLSGAFFSYFIGRLILKNQAHPVAVMVLGTALVSVAHFIPILGIITFLAVIWFGTGIILQELYHRTPKPKYDVK